MLHNLVWCEEAPTAFGSQRCAHFARHICAHTQSYPSPTCQPSLLHAFWMLLAGVLLDALVSTFLSLNEVQLHGRRVLLDCPNGVGQQLQSWHETPACSWLPLLWRPPPGSTAEGLRHQEYNCTPCCTCRTWLPNTSLPTQACALECSCRAPPGPSGLGRALQWHLQVPCTLSSESCGLGCAARGWFRSFLHTQCWKSHTMGQTCRSAQFRGHKFPEAQGFAALLQSASYPTTETTAAAVCSLSAHLLRSIAIFCAALALAMGCEIGAH